MAKEKPEPFCLRIGHRDIAVVPISHKEADKHDADGYFVSNLGVIGIRHPDAPSEQARILLHEILHGIYDIWGYSDKPPADEEEVCGFLDHALAKIFQDNPHLPAILALALGEPAQSPFKQVLTPNSALLPRPATPAAAAATPLNPPPNSRLKETRSLTQHTS